MTGALTGSTSYEGGFWAEGWNYGQMAARNLLFAGLAWENAGLGAATLERTWAGQAIQSLISTQSDLASVYDGGDWYASPAPFPTKDLFYLLGYATTDSPLASYANYIIQNYSSPQTVDFQDLMFRNPSAIASFWSSLPLQTFASGTGLVISRSAWDYNSTWVAFLLGNRVNADHQVDSPGSFEIKRGADNLLIDGNAPGQNHLAHGKSQYTNTVVIDDNGEGNQTYRWSTGYWYSTPGCTINSYQADVGYVYAAGDYRAAYSTNVNPGGGGSPPPLAGSTDQIQKPGHANLWLRRAIKTATDSSNPDHCAGRISAIARNPTQTSVVRSDFRLRR